MASSAALVSIHKKARNDAIGLGHHPGMWEKLSPGSYQFNCMVCGAVVRVVSLPGPTNYKREGAGLEDWCIDG